MDHTLIIGKIYPLLLQEMCAMGDTAGPTERAQTNKSEADTATPDHPTVL